MLALDLNLGCVHLAQDLAGTNTHSLAGLSFVHQSHQSASFGQGLRHDGRLRSSINKSIDGYFIDRSLDVKHSDVAEGFRKVLIGKL